MRALCERVNLIDTGAAARVGTRVGACERVLFVTLCHSSKYAFIVVR